MSPNSFKCSRWNFAVDQVVRGVDLTQVFDALDLAGRGFPVRVISTENSGELHLLPIATSSVWMRREPWVPRKAKWISRARPVCHWRRNPVAEVPIAQQPLSTGNPGVGLSVDHR